MTRIEAVTSLLIALKMTGKSGGDAAEILHAAGVPLSDISETVKVLQPLMPSVFNARH